MLFRSMDENPGEIAATIPIHKRVLPAVAGTRHEIVVRDNLGDAHYMLAYYRDKEDNLTQARAQFGTALNEMSGTAGPAVLANTVRKLGNTDIALVPHAGNPNPMFLLKRPAAFWTPSARQWSRHFQRAALVPRVVHIAGVHNVPTPRRAAAPASRYSAK